MGPTIGKLTVFPSGKSASIRLGVPFRDAIEAAGVSLAMRCGGTGRCGKCKVLFQQGAPPPTAVEEASLTELELLQGFRLGCQVVLTQDAVVYLRDSTRGPSGKVLTSGITREVAFHPWVVKRQALVAEPSVDDLRSDFDRVVDALGGRRNTVRVELIRSIGQELREAGFNVTGVFAGQDLIALERGDTTAECFGVAFDIGTTTLAAYLLDLTSGCQVATAAALNPQSRVGEDVVSRINYTLREPRGLRDLQSAVVSELNRLVRKLARQGRVPTGRIYEATIVGNTCMSHLVLGVDPRNLGIAPYIPAFNGSVQLSAAEVGLKINPSGRVHILPNIAGYVGADTVGTILATALHESDKLTLAVDIGTNGEIVLGSAKRMLACSTAAGPAFEGAHIRHGMRAAPGAIDAVWLEDGDICFGTIGGTKSVGVCGSGLLDAIVCLCQAGIVEPGGRIVDADEVASKYEGLRDRLVDGEFVLATGEDSVHGVPIVISQKDVRELQLAKGAIAAGIRTLMARLGVEPGDLDSVILAGAFGNYMRKESAVTAGLIPNLSLAKIHSVGNAAGEGAKLALMSVEARRDADRIAGSIEYVELTIDPGFQERFAEALVFGAWPDTERDCAINTT